MNETYKVRTVGGSLMVTLPQHVARFTKLVNGDELRIITHKDGKIILTPILTQLEREQRAVTSRK